MKHAIKRCVSTLLCLAMLVSGIPLGSIPAYAAGSNSTTDRTLRDFDADFNYYTDDPEQALQDMVQIETTQQITWKEARGKNWGPKEGDLRDYLTSTKASDKYIRLEGDMATTSARTDWDTIEITTDKVLDLNGHSVVLNDKRNKVDTHDWASWKSDAYYQSDNYSDDFNSVMFSIKNGATLTIIDSSEKGTGRMLIHAYMVDPFAHKLRVYTTRDLFSVDDGNLVIYGGTFQAGRSKQQAPDNTVDNIKKAIGSTISLATSVASYATGINSALGSLSDTEFNAAEAMKKLQQAASDQDSTTPSTGDAAPSSKPDGSGSVTEKKTDTATTENGRKQTISEKQDTKNSAGSAAKTSAKSGAASIPETYSVNNGITTLEDPSGAGETPKAGETSKAGETPAAGESSATGESKKANQSNEDGSAKGYTGNSDIAKAQNAVVNAAIDSDKLNSMVDGAFQLADDIAAIFETPEGSIVSQSLMGTVVNVGTAGTFVSYGGKFIGFGSTPNTRNAVIECSRGGGRCYIYGGEFEAKTGANVFNITRGQNANMTVTQWERGTDGVIKTVQTVVDSNETGGHMPVALANDSTEENIKFVDTSAIQVRGGTFRCHYEYNNVALNAEKEGETGKHDGDMVTFPGTPGAVNLGVESFNKELIKDGRIQIVDNYGDGALVLMDDENTDNQNLKHCRLFCSDDELRFLQYLTVYPENEGLNTSHALSLQTYFNNSDTFTIDKVVEGGNTKDIKTTGFTDDAENERGVFSTNELCFKYMINAPTSGNYYVVPYLSDTDVFGDKLDESDVWYYQAPVSKKGQKLDNFTYGVTNGTTNYARNMKWFTYKVYQVDPITRSNLGEPKVTAIYGADNDSLRCRLPLNELGIDYQAGEMYRIEFSVTEYLNYIGTSTGDLKSLPEASCQSSILFLCHESDERVNIGSQNDYAYTPLQWIVAPEAGKTAKVQLVNAQTGIVDWNTRQIFDTYYQWYAVDENGNETMIAGTDNIDTEGRSNFTWELLTPDSPEDTHTYVNTVDPSKPVSSEYELGTNGLPTNTRFWTNEMLHAYSRTNTDVQTLAKDPSQKVSMKNNNTFLFNSDECYIPEEYAGYSFYVKAIVVNNSWKKVYDHIQTFRSHRYNGVDAKVSLTFDGNGTTYNRVYKAYNTATAKAPDISYLNVKSSSSKNNTVFVGWSRSKDADPDHPDYLPGDEITVKENTVLYAVWRKKILIHYQYSDRAAISDYYVWSGENKLGYYYPSSGKFQGYAIAPAKGEVPNLGFTYDSFDSSKLLKAGDTVNITSETTFYGYVSPEKVSVTLHANGGIPYTNSTQQTTISGDTVVKTQAFGTNFSFGTYAKPANEGDKLLGWSLNADASTLDFPVGSTKQIYQDVDLYAVWRAAPVVISSLNITGVTTPVLGQQPVTYGLLNSNNAHATVTIGNGKYTWREIVEKGYESYINSAYKYASTSAPEQFGPAGTEYRLFIHVTMDPGYKLDLTGSPVERYTECPNYTINGKTSKIIYCENDNGVYSYDFVVDFASVNDAKVIADINVKGLSAISAGNTKTSKSALSTAASSYLVSDITWQEAEGGFWKTMSGTTFVEGTTYRAVITLKTQSGYSFYKAAVPLVNGGTSTYEVEKYSVTAETCTITTRSVRALNTIDSVNITGITEPVMDHGFVLSDLKTDSWKVHANYYNTVQGHVTASHGWNLRNMNTGATSDMLLADEFHTLNNGPTKAYLYVSLYTGGTNKISSDTDVYFNGEKATYCFSYTMQSGGTGYVFVHAYEPKVLSEDQSITRIEMTGIPTLYEGEGLPTSFEPYSLTEGVTASIYNTEKLWTENYGEEGETQCWYYPYDLHLCFTVDNDHNLSDWITVSIDGNEYAAMPDELVYGESSRGSKKYYAIQLPARIVERTSENYVEDTVTLDLQKFVWDACSEKYSTGETSTGLENFSTGSIRVLINITTKGGKDVRDAVWTRVSFQDRDTGEVVATREAGHYYYVLLGIALERYKFGEDVYIDFGNESGVQHMEYWYDDTYYDTYEWGYSKRFARSPYALYYGEHSFTWAYVDESNLAKAADCNSPATYYYKCGNCGKASTETLQMEIP